MKKRLLSTFLVLAMVLSMVPTVAFATGTYASWAEAVAAAKNEETPSTDDYDEATPGNFIIYTAVGLAWFAAEVNSGNDFEGETVNLCASIDLTEAGVTDYGSTLSWTSIGDSVNQFKGTFDGNGYEVSGLYINSSTLEYAGLFGYVGSGGEVKNVSVSGGNTGINAGGVVGYSSGTVTNCSSSVTVTGSTGASGGVVGLNSGSVTNCSATGDVSGDDYAGGVVGKNNGGSVTNCSATGNVSGATVGGGVVGQNSGSVTNCYATTGTVSGTNYAGGVVGQNSDTVTNCYATGAVSGTNYAGGVVGYSSGTVTNCYAAGAVSGTTKGGVVGQNDSGSVSNCYWKSDADNTATAGIGNDDATTTSFTNYGTISEDANALLTNLDTWVDDEKDESYRTWTQVSDAYPVFDAYWAPIFTVDTTDGEYTLGDTTLTITDAGIYTIGASDDGAITQNIVVDSGVSGDVTLNFNNVTINTSSALTLKAIDGDSSNLTIKGTLDVTASTTEASAPAYGIYTDSGDITISDNATVTIQASTTEAGADAYGIYAVSGDITISGDATVGITASATSTSTADITAARGIYAGSGAVSISDTAEVDVTATAKTGSAQGIYTDDGTITISGTADVDITATSDTATANGIKTDDTSNGTVDIKDSATVKIEATGNGVTYGIYAKTSLSIEEDAQVTATATAVGSSANGLYAKTSLSIAGTVTATATATADYQAYGIKADGALTITGTVTATATSNGSQAYGIYTDGALTFDNYTSVKVSGSTQAIYADSTSAVDFDVMASADGTEGSYTETTEWDDNDKTYKYGSSEIAQYLIITPSGGTYTISDKTSGTDYEEHSDYLEIKTPGTYNIGFTDGITTTMKPIKITASGDVSLNFDNVKINIPSTSTVKAIDGASSNLTISGTLDVTATATGVDAYGIYADGALTISGESTLILAKGTTSAIYANTEPDLDTLTAKAYDGAEYTEAVTWDSNRYVLTSDGSTVATDIRISYVPVASTSSGGSSSYTSSVASADNGSVSLSASTNKVNATVTITPTPDEGYEVADVTVTYSSGCEVTVTDNGDGTYSYKQPSASVTVTVSFVEIDSDTEDDGFFTDVDEDDWFYDAVLWAVENGVTTGKSDTIFAPYDINTRAEAVTFLWRAMGEPEWEMCYPFADVDADTWYTDSVYWARVNGITEGTSEDYFSPNVDCSRAQIITMLWRMAGKPVVDSINPFTDVDADSYYYDAVLWAVGEGITEGTSDTTFSPDKDCTRAEIVTFLYRAMAD